MRFKKMIAVSGLALSLTCHAKLEEKPDGPTADMTKPVQVYILLGQSNMLGFGKVNGDQDFTLEHAVLKKGLYPYLKGSNRKFREFSDIRQATITGHPDEAKRIMYTKWVGVPKDWEAWKRAKIGPEVGIGHKLSKFHEAPVLLAKACTGNRGLGWDLMSPSSKAYKHGDTLHPGYGEVPSTAGTKKRPESASWYAGIQWDIDISSVRKILASMDEAYPGHNGYEVAGFFFWQGTRDGNDAHAANYERHLVNFIKDLRKEFGAPKAKFVCATLGQSVVDKNGKYLYDDIGNGDQKPHGPYGQIIQAQLAVDGEKGKYPEFKGNVATVYTHPVSKGGHAGGHYNRHAQTYMNVGELMGEAMVKLMEEKK